MMSGREGKVRTEHLQRRAYLYIRQSTLRQVVENTESTERQYGMRQRAVALGWHDEQVVVIDRDLGKSAASAADRAGFQQLVTEVGLGRAGIVMGLEVSRLARRSSDWHRLVRICALRRTLIMDEDGLYDPEDVNDRLLLELKGTMSEAELHFLRARLKGGRMTVRCSGSEATGVLPHYVGKGAGNAQSWPSCPRISGEGIDEAIGDLVIKAMTPAALDVALREEMS